MATIKAVVTETTVTQGVRQRVVEYRDGGRVLLREHYQTADTEAALAMLKSETIWPTLQALVAKAGPFVGDLMAIDAATGEAVPIEPGIPAARAGQYAALFALYEQTGETTAPADFAAAYALVDAWVKAGASDGERLARLTVAVELTSMYATMLDAGCTWAEALAWHAAQ